MCVYLSENNDSALTEAGKGIAYYTAKLGLLTNAGNQGAIFPRHYSVSTSMKKFKELTDFQL